jgi:hypothetical protein
MPERIFDIVAEHPEEQHVAAEMEDVAMQEGIGDVAQVFRNDDQIRRQLRQIVHDGGDVAEPEHGSGGKVLAADRGQEIHDDVDRDQAERDILQPDVAQVIGIIERNEHAARFRPPGNLISKSAVLAGNP